MENNILSEIIKFHKTPYFIKDVISDFNGLEFKQLYQLILDIIYFTLNTQSNTIVNIYIFDEMFKQAMKEELQHDLWKHDKFYCGDNFIKLKNNNHLFQLRFPSEHTNFTECYCCKKINIMCNLQDLTESQIIQIKLDGWIRDYNNLVVIGDLPCDTTPSEIKFCD